MKKRLCENRTVIITGAGGGLGKTYALALAEAGANVIVNDINLETAEETVSEIIAKDGRAVANNSDITNYQQAGSMVQLALDTFSGLDVIINNAGITRDRMFTSLSEQEWDDVVRVHLKGHFCLASHGAKYWRKMSKEGAPVNARIINTTSGAGLQGSVGQTNYAAAKGGIASLTLVQAAELGRYGVTVNGLAPAARTPMTENVFADMMKKPVDGFDYYDPANVAPLVVWLASHESSQVTGRIFEVEGGRIASADGWRSTEGVNKDQRWDPAELHDAIKNIIAKETPAQKVFGS